MPGGEDEGEEKPNKKKRTALSKGQTPRRGELLGRFDPRARSSVLGWCLQYPGSVASRPSGLEQVTTALLLVALGFVHEEICFLECCWLFKGVIVLFGG